MKIQELLNKEAMILDLKATSKEKAIDEMIHSLFKAGIILDKTAFKQDILKREEQTSTGLGDGIAMPHAKNSTVQKATVLFAKSKKGVDYNALDGQPTYLFFMIAAPKGANNTHLQALAALSRLLLEEDFVNKLKGIETKEAVFALFSAAETKQKEQNETFHSVESLTKENRPYIVAVTACPTGIAHTYMAEDALKKKAKELGVTIKVETNGAEGIQHRLTPEDIQKAKGVIVATDKKVEMARFAGKPLVNRPVSDGIRKPEELITTILENKAPIYQGKKEKNEQRVEREQIPLRQRIYKDLMNGVSHMLPFVIGGGIMIALSFMIDQFLGVPHEQLAKLGNYHTLAHLFNEIGSAAFGFMLPVLAGFIASSIADRPGLIVGFAAGALANLGGAGFLGALFGGFLGGYVIVFLRKVFAHLPKSLEGIKSILFYPFFGLLLTGFLMLLINIPMKAINDTLNGFLTSLSGTNAVLLGLLLGGMMAIDLGGPVNKAAYVFGTATLATTVTEGGSLVMAAVMAGGMVPPLAIFVATRLFKQKFEKSQVDAGLTNIVMGFSFVTEGAIPFAAADPIRVIPSFVLGSALSGALVGLTNIKLLAPHGGIFVIFLVNKPLLYLLFIIIGAIFSGVMYGVLKKPVQRKLVE